MAESKLRITKVMKQDTKGKFPMVIYHAAEEPMRVFSEEELTRRLRTGWSVNRGAFSEEQELEKAIEKMEEQLNEQRIKLNGLKMRRMAEEKLERAYTPPDPEPEDDGEDEENLSSVETEEGDAASSPSNTKETQPPSSKKFVCSICDKDCINQGALATHMKSHVS